jgi:hypothetical protein
MEAVDFFKDVIDENADVGGSWMPVEIVDANEIPANAMREDLVNCSYDHKFVTQSGPGLCDEYSGSIWYPLGGGKYLRADFYC